jgi:hypothetical protein
MGAALTVMALGIGLILLRRPWSRTLVRYTGFLVNKALDPDRVAAGVGAVGLGLAGFGLALALAALR